MGKRQRKVREDIRIKVMEISAVSPSTCDGDTYVPGGGVNRVVSVTDTAKMEGDVTTHDDDLDLPELPTQPGKEDDMREKLNVYVDGQGITKGDDSSDDEDYDDEIEKNMYAT